MTEGESSEGHNLSVASSTTEGCGDRISDMKLVEQSGFLETVPEHAMILTDRKDI